MPRAPPCSSVLCHPRIWCLNGCLMRPPCQARLEFLKFLGHCTRSPFITTITMPPRLNFYGASRSLAIRARPSIASHKPRIMPVVSRRGFADEKEQNPATGPNQDVLGHVSEEAADMGRITGETEPDLGQGTPVQEVCCGTRLRRCPP